MPTERSFVTSCVVNGKIYVFGGGNDNIGSKILSTVEIYDPSTDTWTQGTDMPIPRLLLSSCAVNGLIYVMGGVDNKDNIFSTVEIYDPKNDKWIEGENMPTARISARSYPVLDGKIYIIGGVGSNLAFLSDVWEYTPEGLQSVISSQGKLPTKWGTMKSHK
jgi:N-acetylneuraminic acid mutarotase